MKAINLCPNRIDYYSQLNNEQDPQIACQATTAAQCIDIVDDVCLLKGPYKQPEDNLRRYCKTPDIMNYCVKSHGDKWNLHVSHPSEWADVLIMAINDLMGYKCARFESSLTLEKVFSDLERGLPVQCAMRFLGISGHYVSAVGRTISGDLIINDPYKDWLHNRIDGFNVMYFPSDWKNHSKGYGIRFSRRA